MNFSLSLSIYIYVILKPFYIGNQGSRDFKLQVMKAASFNVSEVLSMWYNNDFGLSEDESRCDEGKVHATEGQELYLLRR